jgi:hypothetical protein
LPRAKYAADLLAQVNMTGCTTIPTPLSTVDKLSLTDGTLLGPEGSTHYRNIVGALFLGSMKVSVFKLIKPQTTDTWCITTTYRQQPKQAYKRKKRNST